MAADLGTTMDALLGCLCTALADAGRPTCGCGTTVGPPMVGPAQCCQCTEGDGQLSVTLQRLYPADGISFAQVPRVENCRPGPVAADLAFTLARCHPTLDKAGNPPTLDQVADAADGMQTDAQTLWNALACCPGHKLVIRDVAVDSDPRGGCSAIGVRVTVLITPSSIGDVS